MKDQIEGERMRFQSIMRTQLVVAGLAAVLSVPGVSRAQEISNTAFDDGPNVAPFAQPVAAQGAASSLSKLPSASDTPEMVASDAPVAAQKNIGEDETSAILIWIGAALVWIGAIGIYFLGPAKHFARELRVFRNSPAATPGD